LHVSKCSHKLQNVLAYDGTSGAGRLPAGVGLGPIRDGTVGAGLDGPPGADLCGIEGFDGGPDLDPGTDLGDGGLRYTYSNITTDTRSKKNCHRHSLDGCTSLTEAQ